MANEKRLIDADKLITKIQGTESKVARNAPYDAEWFSRMADRQFEILEMIDEAPTVDAVEVPCHCCDCYYLLNGKNSFGLYFFCGHQNGLKNLRNTEKDFCLYAERRYGDGNA